MLLADATHWTLQEWSARPGSDEYGGIAPFSSSLIQRRTGAEIA
jgi:hypothetical protein